MSHLGKIAVFGTLSLIVSLYAAPVHAEPIMRTLMVDSGTESVVGRSTFWNGECQPRSVTVTITKKPENGDASIRDGLNLVVANPRFGTAAKCVGKEVMGKQIVYRSKAGFRGVDVLNYESVSDKGEKTAVTVTITVK